MAQIVHVSRLNPKTTEEDFGRFCTRFGDVLECVIFPENDKQSKRSGYVKFSSSQSAEKMFRQSREETLYIDQTSIDVEIRRGNDKPKQNSNLLCKKLNHLQNPMIYTLIIEGGITDEKELINYLNSQPLSIKFIETTNNIGQMIKTGAQVTLNDKDLVDRILQQNHEKYTIKLLPDNLSIKREHEPEQPIDTKRSKLSPTNSYSLLSSHIDSITKLTHNMYEENQRLKSENSSLTITLNQQLTKIKQLECEKTDLVESFSKTHDIAKCLTTKFKVREDEHKKSLDESNQNNSEYELLIQTANETLLTAKNEMVRLTNHVTTLETQIQQINKKWIQSETLQLAQQHDIELFFSALKKIQTD